MGTLWTTDINPYNDFQIGTTTKSVMVTRQGSAVSITISGGSTILGQLLGGRLALDVPNGNTDFGGWYANYQFTPGSLTGYEKAVTAIQAHDQQIMQKASEYANQDVIDANGAATRSTLGNCTLYLSGTDVSMTVHGMASYSCLGLSTEYGDLGSGGSWSDTQTGANYPGQASLVCADANLEGTKFVVVADAGGQSYGSTLCSDLDQSHSWYTVQGTG